MAKGSGCIGGGVDEADAGAGSGADPVGVGVVRGSAVPGGDAACGPVGVITGIDTCWAASAACPPSIGAAGIVGTCGLVSWFGPATCRGLVIWAVTGEAGAPVEATVTAATVDVGKDVS